MQDSINECNIEFRQFFNEVILTGSGKWLLFLPEKQSYKLLNVAIATGYNPNTQVEELPALGYALDWVSRVKPGYPANAREPLEHLWSTISLLIRAGADIYVMFQDPQTPSSGTWYNPDYFAYCCVVLDEWDAALQECGYDPREVARESVRRLREHDARQDVYCSAVDEDELRLPLREGLGRRTGRVFEEL